MNMNDKWTTVKFLCGMLVLAVFSSGCAERGSETSDAQNLPNIVIFNLFGSDSPPLAA